MLPALVGGPSAVVFSLNALMYVFFQWGDLLYYTKTSKTGITNNVFGDKTLVPNTGISFNPSAVEYNGKIYVFHHGNFDHGDIWYNTFDGTNWSGDRSVCTGCISYSPGAVVYKGKIYLFCKMRSDDRLGFRATGNGVDWGAPVIVPNTWLSDSPSAVVYKDILYVFHQGVGNSGELWYNTFDGTGWGGDTRILGAGMSASPGAAVYGDKLYVFHQSYGHTGAMWYSAFNGTTWAAETQVSNVGMSDKPSPVAFDGMLYVFHQGIGDNRDLWYPRFNGQWLGSRQVQINIVLAFTSDPQYVWCEPGINPGCPTGKDEYWVTVKDPISRRLIRGQYLSVNNLKNSVVGSPFQGVIVNGDLTAYGHPWQLNTFKDELLSYLPQPHFMGLGNHDYSNNIGDCYGNTADSNTCASRMVDYMYDHVKSRPGLVDIDFYSTGIVGFPNYGGSLSYSFNIENIHIVQLQNHPEYTKYWTNYRPHPAATISYDIRQSITWLKGDLQRARDRGYKIILNMHNWDDGWNTTRFRNEILNVYPITAIFAGHYHQNIGYETLINNTPLFYCGSAMYRHYLYVTFDINRNKMVVRKIVNNEDNGVIISIEDDEEVDLR